MKAEFNQTKITNLSEIDKNKFIDLLTEEVTKNGRRIRKLIKLHNKQKFRYYYPNEDMGLVVILDDPNPINKFPKFIQKWFTKTYLNQGMVQFDEGKLTICGDSIRWLEKIDVRTTSSKRANMLSFVFLRNKYPEYEGYLQLF